MKKELDVVIAAKNGLNSVSPSFCLAKWLQTTLHLHSGRTHSCHHCPTHAIAAGELAANPSALHNTQEKKLARAQMLRGEQPSECSYCWEAESLAKDQISDRHLKSSMFWAAPQFKRIANLAADADVHPTSLEISFSRSCNFKCSYCSSDYSSSWAQEVAQHGPYADRPMSSELGAVRDGENPYVEAFWRWWPDLKKDLQVLRITGGEPLLSPDTFRVFERVAEEGLPRLRLALNSNLGVSDEKIDRLIGLAARLTGERKVSEFRIYTSLEAWGKQAEYIRYGMDFPRFWGNVEKILRNAPSARLCFMVTFNSLSLPSFHDFLEGCLELRAKFPAQVAAIDITHLRYPEFQAIHVLPASYQEEMRELVEFMRARTDDASSRPTKFFSYETVKLERAYSWMKKELEPPIASHRRAQFFRYFSEHDRRRGTSFPKTFPGLVDFWHLCEKAAGSL